MILFLRESIADLMEGELWPIMVAHREELTLNKRLMELAPDIAQYRALEKAGICFCITAREDGVIVGYSVSFIGPHLHYKRVRHASNDLLFLVKEKRCGSLGLKLMRATLDEARRQGAQVYTWHAKAGTTLDRLLPKMGYTVQDILYSKEL